MVDVDNMNLFLMDWNRFVLPQQVEERTLDFQKSETHADALTRSDPERHECSLLLRCETFKS